MDFQDSKIEKLKNSFGHKVIENLSRGIIREMYVQDEKINFIVEFQFKDSSAFAFFYSVEKEKIKGWGSYANTQ